MCLFDDFKKKVKDEVILLENRNSFFKLGDTVFEVKDARIWGSLADEKNRRRHSCPPEKGGPPLPVGINLKWALSIDMVKQEYEDEMVEPNLYHNNGFHIDIKSWKKLEGVKLVWDSEYNQNDEEAGSLYIFDHENLHSGTMEFLERKGDLFRFKWCGTYYEESFELECLICFNGIEVNYDEEVTDKQLKDDLSKFIDISELDLKTNEYGRTWFFPKLSE